MKLRDYGIMPESPKGRLIRRNVEDFPDLPLDAHVREAERLLADAAKRKSYTVLTLKRDHAMRLKTQKWRERLGAPCKSHGGPS